MNGQYILKVKEYNIHRLVRQFLKSGTEIAIDLIQDAVQFSLPAAGTQRRNDQIIAVGRQFQLGLGRHLEHLHDGLIDHCYFQVQITNHAIKEVSADLRRPPMMTVNDVPIRGHKDRLALRVKVRVFYHTDNLSTIQLILRCFVEGMVARFRDELGKDMKMVATGGLAEVVAEETEVIEIIAPWLTLDGLRLVWELNKIR